MDFNSMYPELINFYQHMRDFSKKFNIAIVTSMQESMEEFIKKEEMEIV